MKKFIKKITHTAKSAVTCVKTAAVNSMSAVLAFNRRAVCSNAGEGYIDTAVKVLIAVVLGALVLAGRSPIPFLLRTALLLILRLTLSLWCRATAGNISDPALQHPSGVRGLSPLMQRHLAGLLASAAAGAAVCGLYTALVFL